jgi:hypothetical protein
MARAAKPLIFALGPEVGSAVLEDTLSVLGVEFCVKTFGRGSPGRHIAQRAGASSFGRITSGRSGVGWNSKAIPVSEASA